MKRDMTRSLRRTFALLPQPCALLAAVRRRTAWAQRRHAGAAGEASAPQIAQRTFATPGRGGAGARRRHADGRPASRSTRCWGRAAASSSTPATRSPTTRCATTSSPRGTSRIKFDSDGDAKATLLIGANDYAVPVPAGEGRDGLAIRRQGGRRGDRQPPHRPERARRDPGVPRLRRRAARIRAEGPRRQRPARLRAEAREPPGKHDGLYWPTKAGEPPSPARSAGRAGARGKGYGRRRKAKPAAYHGYRYRILTAQGPGCAGRRVRLHRERQDDRRLRAGRVARRARASPA